MGRLPLILLFFLLATRGYATVLIEASIWQNELFQRSEGGIVIGITLQKFPKKSAVDTLTSPIRILARNILTKEIYQFTYEVGSGGKSNFHYWKARAGKYAIQAISLVDANGNLRRYIPRNPKTFIIKRQNLSNLGIWVLRPMKKSYLSFGVRKVANPYNPEVPEESSVASVIDGFTGILQKKIAGDHLEKNAMRDHSSGNQLRAAFAAQRQIGMFFKLDLLKHNQYARSIANVLKANDANLRDCYSKRLDDAPNLKGVIKFTFLLSKETSSIRRITHSGGTLQDGQVISCLSLHLQGITFPVPTTMVGTLEYHLFWN